MHTLVEEDRDVLADIGEWVLRRLSGAPPPAGAAEVSLPGIGPDGIGTAATWAALRDGILPTAFPTDHPRYLAFVGGAPTPAAVLVDAALSAASVYGGSRLEAGSVVAAEHAAVAWLCGVLGYPRSAGGTFTSGGSLANLSALVAARHASSARTGRTPGTVVCAASAHSSVRAAATIMGCRVVGVGGDHPLSAAELDPVLDALEADDVVAVVASAGATNTGEVDVLDDLAKSCSVRGLWLHVDAAYGGAAMLAPAQRHLFAGIGQADSVTLDPHKWLFTPYECAAVLYRDPTLARAAHRQQAHYLAPTYDGDDDGAVDNPADLAVHLSRRARGLPLWASLVANGTEGYVDAVERCLATAGHAAKRIASSTRLELVREPRLSVVLFRRRGWSPADHTRWSQDARNRGLALVTPTVHAGETVLRLCFVNPRTTTEDVDLVLDSLCAD